MEDKISQEEEIMIGAVVTLSGKNRAYVVSYYKKVKAKFVKSSGKLQDTLKSYGVA